MTQAPNTLANIALSFTAELAAREERLRAEQARGLDRIAELIQAGFDGIRKDMDGIRNDVAELKASVRELRSGWQNLEGQITAMQGSEET